MGKKTNKYQKFSRNNDENDEEIIKVSISRKNHGDQRKAEQRAKQQRQDIEFISAVSEINHAA